jgi:hypothetical protein
VYILVDCQTAEIPLNLAVFILKTALKHERRPPTKEKWFANYNNVEVTKFLSKLMRR